MDWLLTLQTAYQGWAANVQDFEILKHFFNPKMQADIGEWLIKIAVVWVLMGRRVKEWASTVQKNLQTGIDKGLNTFTEHTQAIERQLKEVVQEMKHLKEAVATDLSKHSKEIGELRVDVNEVKHRLTKVEQPKG